MSTMLHTVSPAQADIIAEMKRIADTANNQLNNSIAIIIAGVAPVGSRLVEYREGVMTIEVPETKLVDKNTQAVENVPAVDIASTQEPA